MPIPTSTGTFQYSGTQNVTTIHEGRVTSDGLQEFFYRLDGDAAGKPITIQILPDLLQITSPPIIGNPPALVGETGFFPGMYPRPAIVEKVIYSDGQEGVVEAAVLTEWLDPVSNTFRALWNGHMLEEAYADALTSAYGLRGTYTPEGARTINGVRHTGEYYLRFEAVVSEYDDAVLSGRFLVRIGPNPSESPAELDHDRDRMWGDGWVQAISQFPDGLPTVPTPTPTPTPTPSDLPAAALPQAVADATPTAGHVVYETPAFRYNEATSSHSIAATGEQVTPVGSGRGALIGSLLDSVVAPVKAAIAGAGSAFGGLRDALNNPATVNALNALDTGETEIITGFADIIEGTRPEADAATLEQTLETRGALYKSGAGLILPTIEAVETWWGGIRKVFSFSDMTYTVDVDVNAVKEAIALPSGHHDVFLGSGGADEVDGGDLNDALMGRDGADRLFGGAGDDLVFGGVGKDYVRGGAGNDIVQGGADFDDAHGNEGDDTVSGGAGGDWVVGGKDNDRLFGEDGDDVVYGNLGNDTQSGDDGNDWVRGGQGSDVLSGGAGNDWMSGDRDNDTLSGGAGADTFNTFAGAGIDRVTDFSRAQGDRVKVEPGATYTVAQVGADVVVSVSGGGQLILSGVSLTSLSGDWIFVG